MAPRAHRVRSRATMIIILLFAATVAWGQAKGSIGWHLGLELKVSSLAQSAAPQIFSDNLILTYQDPDPYRNNRIQYVGAAFSNENFTHIHTFQRNSYGVYFLVYPLPEGVSQIQYRLVVDGLWIADPKNQLSVVSPDSGIRLSVAEIPPQPSLPQPSPRILPGDQVEFDLHSTPGQAVFVAGSFNNWDPYMHRMEETSPGNYTLTIRVRPGTYYYYYVTDGRRVDDPLNNSSAFAGDGSRVSVFNVARS